MELYFTDKKNIFSTYLRITGAEAHHISRVMRHKIGDMIYVTDGNSNEYQTMLKKIDHKTIEASIINKTRNAREPLAKISLAQAMIKGSHFDLIVEKTTELGVYKIIPIKTERTIASLSANKLERFQKIMLAAVKSSTRTHIPSLQKPITLENLFPAFADYDLVVLAYEDEKNLRLADIIKDRFYTNILLIIGPEGGFTKNEIAQAQSYGAQSITIGNRRLRAETAAITALSILLYQLKEM
jgi:16S rRNA (uracil1498-N3)-methyltransferase